MENKENDQDLNILSDDEIEIIDVNSDSDEPEEESNSHPVLKILLISLGAFILVAVIFILLIWTRLNKWSSSTVSVDKSNIKEGMYDVELNDYYVYISEDKLADHPDDGEENILFIGNSFITHEAGGKSLTQAVAEKLNANVYVLATDYGKITNDTPYPEGPSSVADNFSLCRIVNAIIEGGNGPQIGDLSEFRDSVFTGDSAKKADDYIETVTTIDMNKIDTIIIMYSLVDYYHSVPTLIVDEEQVSCYYGALLKAVTTLQEAYPHINIVLSSPTPCYVEEEDGTTSYSTLKSYGLGNSSAYIEMMYYVATKCCVSYIDNYAYGITDLNIKDYIKDFQLTEAGIELVSKHIAYFMETKPVAIELAPTDYGQ